MILSKKCLAIEPSITLAIDAKAKKMKAEGIDVVGFGAGEPDFDTPSFIKDAAKKALDLGMTKYTPASGTLELRKAICEKLKRANGLDYEPGQIVVSNGAKHSLFNTFAAILNPKDEVIIPVPYWVTYPELVRFCDGVPVFVDVDEHNGFVASAEAIKKAITPRTKAILLNSPSNPCGAVYTEQQIRAIAALAVENDLFLVSDEIYEELIYDGNKHFSPAQISGEVKERTILINGFSKAYAMTGWRLGYTASVQSIAKAMGSLQSHATSNPNSIAQYAGIAALYGPRDELNAMVNEFDRRRKYMVARINSIDSFSCATPQGAFYVMLNISHSIGKSIRAKTIGGSMDFCAALLEEKNVALVPGIAFGADSYCRLSYALGMDNITRGLDRIEQFMSLLK